MATVFGSLVRAALLAAAVGQRTARVPPYAEGIEQVLAAYAAATGGYGFAVGVVDGGGVAWGAGAGQRTTVGGAAADRARRRHRGRHVRARLGHQTVRTPSLNASSTGPNPNSAHAMFTMSQRGEL